MALSEQQTKLRFINPALERAGWTMSMVAQEMSTGRVDAKGDWSRGTADYVLYVNIDGKREVAAVLEAKAVSKSAESGAPQAREYATSIGAPFAYATNGHVFVQVGPAGQLGRARKLDDFPSPAKMRKAHPIELSRLAMLELQRQKKREEKERRERQRQERERRKPEANSFPFGNEGTVLDRWQVAKRQRRGSGAWRDALKALAGVRAARRKLLRRP